MSDSDYSVKIVVKFSYEPAGINPTSTCQKEWTLDTRDGSSTPWCMGLLSHGALRAIADESCLPDDDTTDEETLFMFKFVEGLMDTTIERSRAKEGTPLAKLAEDMYALLEKHKDVLSEG